MINDVVKAHSIASRLYELAEEYLTLGNFELHQEIKEMAQEIAPDKADLNCMQIEPGISLCVENRIKEARNLQGLSLAKLSDSCGGHISPNQIQNIEAGRSQPTILKALALSYALQVPVTTLFYLKKA